MTRRSHLFAALKLRMSCADAARPAPASSPRLTFGPVEALDVVLVERGRHRLDRLEEVGDRLDVLVAVEHAALAPRPRRRCRGTGPRRRRRCRPGSRAGRTRLISGERFSVRLPSRMVPIWVSEPMGRPLPRRACSTPAMNVEATAPRPTSRMPRRPSAGWIGSGLSSTKSFASKITPLWRASDMSGSCHWAGTRPVLAQCSIVLCRLPSRAARALWPPKRLMIRSAAFVSCSMADILTNFSLSRTY